MFFHPCLACKPSGGKLSGGGGSENSGIYMLVTFWGRLLLCPRYVAIVHKLTANKKRASNGAERGIGVEAQ